MAIDRDRNESKGYLYFPGCSLKGTGVAYEESLLTLFRLLDIPLEEVPDWNCCGATSYMSMDENAAFVLSARNLSLAHQAGPRDLLVPCTACFLALRKTQNYMREYPAIQRAVEEALGRAGLSPPGPVRVRHPLEVIYNDVGVDQVKARLVRPWKGGQVASYYGCQGVRPYPEVDQNQDPRRMDELLQAVGVPVVEYALKTKCCGGSLTGTIHPIGSRLNYILLKEAIRKGAQAIATICPLCQFNLDMYQPEMRRKTREPLDIPVLYFTQILGWALGGDPASLGIRRGVAGRDLLKKWLYVSETVETYV
jgi:heterodisulfide reductase subunit B